VALWRRKTAVEAVRSDVVTVMMVGLSAWVGQSGDCVAKSKSVNAHLLAAKKNSALVETIRVHPSKQDAITMWHQRWLLHAAREHQCGLC
jgi:hypothetical protein